jgi:hypothetical protein
MRVVTSQVLIASIASFFAYTSVYAFRKPFTVGHFDGMEVGKVSYQTILVIAQVIGYMLSKFSGIRIIGGLRRYRRWTRALLFVGLSWLSLLLFAWLPWWAGIVCLFANGYFLGFMWGVIFSYVEGRRYTDIAGTVMAASFIFAGGFTRSVAIWLRQAFAVGDHWLPFVTGALFILPLVVFIWLLEHLRLPDEEDERERSPRVAMKKGERNAVLKHIGIGLAVIVSSYVLLTILRDIRDNFMANMWRELGYGTHPSVFTYTETAVTIVVMALMSLFVFVRQNMRALRLLHLMIMGGFLLAGLASTFFKTGIMDGKYWMFCTGLGLYMAYIPFNCIFFERLISTFRLVGNAGFLMYITDAFGYLGSVLVMLAKEFVVFRLQWTAFFAQCTVYFSVLGILGVMASLIWFNQQYNKTGHHAG